MPKHDPEITRTDPTEIEQLIDRLKQSNLAPRDMALIERLLRMVLSLSRLLQQRNTSLKRLKRMIFGPGSDNRAASLRIIVIVNTQSDRWALSRVW
jgi:hypothetical protein